MKICDLQHVDVEDAAKEAANVLAAGSLLIYPTDTFYNLAVSVAFNDAVEVFKDVKGRASNRPFFSVFPSLEVVEQYAEIPEEARRIAEKFLPGPLALILPAKRGVPETMLYNGTISVRMPNHAFTKALSAHVSIPFLTTNANKRGRELPKTTADVLNQFSHDGRQIGLIVEDGRHYSQLPLTVITFASGSAVLQREGLISREELGL